MTRLSVCLSLFLSSVLVFGLFEFFFILRDRKIQHFPNTHTQEKRKEKKRDYFSHPTLHTHFFVHTQKTLKTHKREKDSFVVLVPHTLFRLFLFSLSLLLKRKHGGRGETSGAVGSREKEIRDVQSEKVIVKTTTTTTTTTEREREEGRGRNDDSDDDDDDT